MTLFLRSWDPAKKGDNYVLPKEGNKIFQTDKRQGIKDQNHKEKYREGFDEGEVILHTLVAVTTAPHTPPGAGGPSAAGGNP